MYYLIMQTKDGTKVSNGYIIMTCLKHYVKIKTCLYLFFPSINKYSLAVK